tara:strand:- start:1315 stop:1503 length:189 start_codon:yes stop_codon:yes gene_type:complete
MVLIKKINKWFAYIGFPLIFIAAFRAIPHMLAGDPNAANRKNMIEFINERSQRIKNYSLLER